MRQKILLFQMIVHYLVMCYSPPLLPMILYNCIGTSSTCRLDDLQLLQIIATMMEGYAPEDSFTKT